MGCPALDADAGHLLWAVSYESEPLRLGAGQPAPRWIGPPCLLSEGNLFAAASESVPLLNLGFQPEDIKSLPPGFAITIVDGKFIDQRIYVDNTPVFEALAREGA